MLIARLDHPFGFIALPYLLEPVGHRTRGLVACCLLSQVLKIDQAFEPAMAPRRRTTHVQDLGMDLSGD